MKIKKTKRVAAALLTAAAMAAPLTAWGTLRIHKVKGDVTVKSGTKCRKAVKRETVAETDQLIIPRGGEIAVHDDHTRRVYYSLTQGDMTVKKLIADAANSASQTTRATNRVLMENAVADSRSGQSVGGVSIHRTNGVIHAPVELPKGMSYLQYLRSLGDREYNDETDAILLRRDINYDDETFNFAVFNTLKEPLYFNVIQQRTDRDPELHFLDNAVAAPRTQTVVEEYVYLLPDYPDGYIVVASDRDFTIEDVKKLLDPEYEPQADFYFTLLRK